MLDILHPNISNNNKNNININLSEEKIKININVVFIIIQNIWMQDFKHLVFCSPYLKKLCQKQSH